MDYVVEFCRVLVYFGDTGGQFFYDGLRFGVYAVIQKKILKRRTWEYLGMIHMNSIGICWLHVAYTRFFSSMYAWLFWRLRILYRILDM